MGIFTSKANGNLSASGQTTWNEVGVPGNGDRAIISHAIAVDVDTTVGPAGASGQAGTGTVGTGGVSSATLTGSSTVFTTQLAVGDVITVTGVTNGIRTVTAIASDTSLTLSDVITVANGTAWTWTPGAIHLTGTSARLTVNAGVKLTVKGAVSHKYASTTRADVLTVGAGGGVEFDVPSGSVYPYYAAIASQNATRLVFNGTSGSHCYFRGKAGGGSTCIAAYGNNGVGIWGGWLHATFTDFSKLNNASNQAWDTRVSLSAGEDLYLEDCTFDSACGSIGNNTSVFHSAAVVHLVRVKHLGTTATQSLFFQLGAIPTGERLVQDCYFEGQAAILNLHGLTWSNSTAKKGFASASVIQNPQPTITHLLYGYTNNNGPSGLVNFTDTYFIYDISTANWHALGNSTANAAHTRLIFDSSNTAADGDLIAGPANATATLSATNCLVLPNPIGLGPGELVSPLITAGVGTITDDHNTVTVGSSATSPGTENGVGVYGETQSGQAGEYASMRSNLVYTPPWATGAKGWVFARHNTAGSNISDVIQADGSGNVKADYNCLNNPYTVTTTAANVYAVYGAHGGYVDRQSGAAQPLFTSTTGLGSHDVIADPQLVDPTRNFATWYTAYLNAFDSSRYPITGDWTGLAGGASIAVGTIYTRATSSYFNSATIAYRCISAHTKGTANSDPGTGSSFRTFWESAGWEALRTDAGRAYNAGVPQATAKDLYLWVQAGWRPTNTAVKDAGHDGVTIGALEGVFPASTRWRRRIPRGVARGILRGVA